MAEERDLLNQPLRFLGICGNHRKQMVFPRVLRERQRVGRTDQTGIAGAGM